MIGVHTLSCCVLEWIDYRAIVEEVLHKLRNEEVAIEE